MTIMNRLKELHEQTKALNLGLFQDFSKLSLDEKIDLYCNAYLQDEGVNKLLDTFLNKDGYYHHCEGVSLYDDLYWERYETMTLSDVFDWIVDNFDEETHNLYDFVKNAQHASNIVFRDMLLNNIGSAERDW